ncbi:MAG TPA: hypothetical protein VFE98_00470 [Candidatus Bathyarchaeia archaeon]|nr:hypothetical protein [Candidatus Bathyarchaeia archaeon]
MKLLGDRKKKGNQDPSNVSTPALTSRLQELTGSDDGFYRAMSRLMFLDPKKITTSLEDAVKQAQDYESAGNKTRAELWYRIAGGISLYRGDIEAVRKFFQKASIVSGNARPEYDSVAKQPERAVETAKKYYEGII